MVEVAACLNPGIVFRGGDILDLDLPDRGLSRIVAFYSLIHVSRASVLRALQEAHRVLLRDGYLLIAIHGGDGVLHADEFLGLPASIDATLFQPEEMARYVRQAGFGIASVATRPPYEFEFQTTRSTSGPPGLTDPLATSCTWAPQRHRA